MATKPNLAMVISMKNCIKYFLAIVILHFFSFAHSHTSNSTVSLDLQNVNIQEALHILAKFLKINIALAILIFSFSQMHLLRKTSN